MFEFFDINFDGSSYLKSLKNIGKIKYNVVYYIMYFNYILHFS
jgi:hypothetical protein